MNKRQDLSDYALILKYKEGNTSMLPALVKRYHKIFCQKAYWITKDKESAKDIAQESWISIIGKLDSLKNVDSFKSWAFRIVYTKAIDIIKLGTKEGKNLESVRNFQSGLVPPKDDGILKQKALQEAIQKLSKEKQDIIRLFYAESYSIKGISDFLNIPIGTVKSRLFKAREKLKSTK